MNRERNCLRKCSGRCGQVDGAGIDAERGDSHGHDLAGNDLTPANGIHPPEVVSDGRRGIEGEGGASDQSSVRWRARSRGGYFVLVGTEVNPVGIDQRECRPAQGGLARRECVAIPGLMADFHRWRRDLRGNRQIAEGPGGRTERDQPALVRGERASRAASEIRQQSAADRFSKIGIGRDEVPVGGDRHGGIGEDRLSVLQRIPRIGEPVHDHRITVQAEEDRRAGGLQAIAAGRDVRRDRFQAISGGVDLNQGNARILPRHGDQQTVCRQIQMDVAHRGRRGRDLLEFFRRENIDRRRIRTADEPERRAGLRSGEIESSAATRRDVG